MKIISRIIPAVLIFLIPGSVIAQHDDKSGIVVQDKLIPSLPNSLKIDGYVGEKIDQCIQNRLMVQDVESLLDLFRIREKDNFGFNAEFLGKWSAASALGIRYQPNHELQEVMDNAVRELIKTQSADGYITTYKKGDEFQMWDVWNQKYVLLGLVAQYDLSGNGDYLAAAVKSADHLMSCLGPGKISLEEYGHPAHKGGCNYSILEPVVLLYERTGEKRFLDYANYIVDSWSKPS